MRRVAIALARRKTLAVLVVAACSSTPAWAAENAMAWLARVAAAAQSLNYTGTIVFQHGARVETSRIVHLNDDGQQFEKLTNLDGPAREVIRSHGEVRCYYPDAKIVRIEPRTFRNVFPALSQEQQQSLAQHYEFRAGEETRVAGREARAFMFEPKDGMRYGHKFWADAATGLLLKARLINERNETVEQFAFLEVVLGAKVDRDMVKPTWTAAPPDWQVRQGPQGEVAAHETGWVVNKLPPGFSKIREGFRRLRGKPEPVAHLVFTDGLVAISVFVEPASGAPAQAGMLQQGGLNVYSVKHNDYMITALGEAPAATIRQIAMSVARRQ